MKVYKIILILFIFFTFLIKMAQSQPEYRKFIHKKEDNKHGFLTNFFINILNQKPFNGSYAIIIAVGNYDKLLPLKSSQEDAKKMERFLLGTLEYDEVVMLQDNDATFDNIRYFMQTYFANKMAKYGRYRFLFYFTGHGTQHKDYDSRTIGYLQLKGATGEIGDINSINMNQIQNWADQFQNASHMLFLLDSCFSGLAGVETKGYDTKISIDDISKGDGRYLLVVQMKSLSEI